MTGGGVGVTLYAILRCLRVTSAVPASSLLGAGSFLAGFLLTEARLGLVACSRPGSSSTDSSAPQRRDGVDAAVYLACGVLVAVCSGAAPLVSASLYLALVATYPAVDSPAWWLQYYFDIAIAVFPVLTEFCNIYLKISFVE